MLERRKSVWSNLDRTQLDIRRDGKDGDACNISSLDDHC